MFFNICSTRVRLKLESARQEHQGIVQILHSEYRWHQVRNLHVKSEPCCQTCALERELEAHHIQPWHLAEELRYDPANLITLCRECHFRFGHYLDWQNFNPAIRELAAFMQQLKQRHDPRMQRVIVENCFNINTLAFAG